MEVQKMVWLLMAAGLNPIKVFLVKLGLLANLGKTIII